MFHRDEFLERLDPEQFKFVLNHFTYACRIRMYFQAVQLPWKKDKKQWFIPGCHDAAHAYAEAFGGEPVEGECAFFIEKHHQSDGTYTVDVSTYTHSWIRIPVDDDLAVILDLYPELSISAMPKLVFDPHPGYWVPTDKQWQKVIQEYYDMPYRKETTALLALAFKRAVREGA